MNANDIVMNYIAAWNERDPAKRRATVAKAWAPNGTYVDPHRKASGLDEIDAMLGGGRNAGGAVVSGRYGLHPRRSRWPQQRRRGLR
jgi:hypothetical protein